MNAIHAVANRRLASNETKKLIYPAADRNKDPILDVLKRIIRRGPNQVLLEIASGSGQHISYFAPHFPQVTFYPSDHEESLLHSITAYTNNLSNVHDPLLIDISIYCKRWQPKIFTETSIDYIYCANMIHISPFECTVGLFSSAGYLLKPYGLLVTYGAYAINGKITPDSNINFDCSLRAQDPSWGLRDIEDLEILAGENDLMLWEIIDMPANNKTLIWKKKE